VIILALVWIGMDFLNWFQVEEKLQN